MNWNWQSIRRRSATNARLAKVVEETLLEAEQRISRAQPVGPVQLSFKGGTARATGVLQQMRKEVGTQ